MEKTLGYDWEYGHEELEIRVSTYLYENHLFIGLHQMEDGEPFGDLTVNLPLSRLEYNEAYIDNFDAENKLKFIRKHRLGEVLPEKGHSGYCEYYKVAFDMERLQELDPDGVEQYRKRRGMEKKQQTQKKRKKNQIER